MISPVVIMVTEDERTASVSVLLQQPVLGDGRPCDLGWNGTDPAFGPIDAVTVPPSAVSDAGKLLYQQLASHDDVRAALEAALLAGQTDRRPLLLDLRVGAAMEALPWETVYAPGKGFLGLDPRWSVGRRVRSAEGLPSASFVEPLRIAAFLSCLDVSARSEWEQLAAAVAASPVGVDVLLFVGEGDLRKDLLENTPPWVRLEGIPASATDLTTTMRNHSAAGFVPHVLHFFCHGSLVDGAHLEIATTSDWAQLQPRQSSLTLEPQQVLGLAQPTDPPWLVMLNCCQSAAPQGAPAQPGGGAATHSLARELVQRGGLPAVIGMRRPIDSADATSFSSVLYREMFGALAAQQDGVAVAPDWSGLVVAARQRLAEQQGVPFEASASRRRQWTLPVLYVRHVPDTLEFFTLTRTGQAPPIPGPVPGPVPAPPSQTELRIALLRDVLAGLGPEAPTTFRAELEAEIAMLGGEGR